MSDSHSTQHPTGPRSVWPMFFGALVLIAIFWAAAWILRSGPSGATDEAEKAEVRRKNLEELTAANQEELESYGWVDREKGIVRLPIEQAMDLEMAKLNEQEPRAAYPVSTPPPAVPTPEAGEAPAGEPAPDAAISAPDAAAAPTSDPKPDAAATPTPEAAATTTPVPEVETAPAAEPQGTEAVSATPVPATQVVTDAASGAAPAATPTPEAEADAEEPASEAPGDSTDAAEQPDAQAVPTPPGADPRKSPEPTPTNEPS